MPPETRRILISDATSYKAIVLARFVKRLYPSVVVVTCDHRPASRLVHTRHSDFHAVLAHGPARGEAFVAAVADLVREQRIDLLIPVHSREMDLLVPARESLGRALDYVGEASAYETLHRKDRLHALALERGVRVPERFPDAASIRPPAVAKPVTGSSAKGVRYLRDAASVAAFVAGHPDMPRLVVQQHVDGEGVGYSVFAQDGTVRVGYGHRRLAEFPTSGGSSVYRERDDDPRLRPLAESLVRAARWSGFAMFEWKRDRSGELFLLEANPRVWGSIHQGLQDRANFLEPLLGPPERPIEPGAGRTYLSPLVYLALARYALGGRFGPAASFARNWARNRADVPLLGDPAGFASMLLRAGPDA